MNALAIQPRAEIAGVLEIKRARPMVSTLKIAELFDRRHDNVLAAVRKVSARQSGLLIRKEMSPDERGRDRPVYWLDEEAALVVMPFIGGKHAMEGQRTLVKAYLWYRDNFANPPRTEVIRAKRDASRLLTDSIVEWRAFEGKKTAPVHFISEQKLCNWVVTGRFESLDERMLSNEDVDLLRRVREMNAALIAAGIEYNERKKRLVAFAIRQRTKLLEQPAS